MKKGSGNGGDHKIEYKKVKEFDERLKKLETKYLDISEDELEPDMPAILDVLNTRLAEIDDIEDYEEEMDLNTLTALVTEYYEILHIVVKYACMKGYKVDLLDEQMGKVVKLQSFIEKEEGKKKKPDNNTMFA